MSQPLLQAEEIPTPAVDQRRGERGVSIVLGSLVLLVLIGMAGFAVDLGWLFLQQTNARKTAEAAALAGVVHMPQPSDVAFIGGEAYTTARDVASANGHVPSPGVTEVNPAEVAGRPHQLRVDVSDTVDTFFMRVFGINEVQVNAAAIAEQLPPLKLGSDENHLGPGADDVSDEQYWVAVNGDRTHKGQGDAYTSEFLGDFNTPSQGANPNFLSPSYWYAIEVPSTHVGDTLKVELYDPQVSPSDGPTNDRSLNNPNFATDPHANSITRFRLLEPDTTPNDPTDNSDEVCSFDYRHHDNGSYVGAWEDAWVNFCSDSALRGIYVLEVTQIGNVDLLNAFAFRAKINDSLTNDVAIYGLGAMSLWFHDNASEPDFKIVRLDEIYAGQQLIISLWDAGDITGGTGFLEFIGSLEGIECQVQVRDDEGIVTDNWSADSGNLTSTGGVGCRLDIPEREYNNEWLDFRFDVPASYTCTGDACWASVLYRFVDSGGNPIEPHDRTTWAATINGQPIHLIQ